MKEFITRAALVARIITAAIVLAILWVFVTPVVAFAASLEDPAIIIAPTSLNIVDVLQGLVVPLLPALVGLVNRLSADRIPTLWKRLMLVGLATIGQVLPDLIESANGGKPFDLISALFWAGVAWAFAEFVYGKLYQAPIAKTEPAVGTATVPVDGTNVVTVAVEPKPVTIASKIAGT